MRQCLGVGSASETVALSLLSPPSAPSLCCLVVVFVSSCLLLSLLWARGHRLYRQVTEYSIRPRHTFHNNVCLTPSHIQVWTYGALSLTHTALDKDGLALHASGTRVHALHLHFQDLVISALMHCVTRGLICRRDRRPW